MDIAKLQLTIDETPANDAIARIEARLLALPSQAVNAARGVNTAFGQISSVGAVSQTLMLQTQLAGLQQTMNAVLISTNSLNMAVGNMNTSGARSQIAQQNSALNGTIETIAKVLISYRALREAYSFASSIADTRMAFDRLEIGLKALTGSSQLAAQQEEFLIRESDRLGLSIRTVAPEFIKITAAMTQSGFTLGESEKLFTDVSIATKALGLSSSTTNRILYDFQEMVSMGTVQLRQLRQMIMQIPGGLEVAARAMGVTTDEFHHMVQNGLDARDFITKFGDELSRTFGGSMNEAAQNLESNVNRMSNAWELFKKSLSEGPIGGLIAGTVKSATEVVKALDPNDADGLAAQSRRAEAEEILKKSGTRVGAYKDEWREHLPEIVAELNSRYRLTTPTKGRDVLGMDSAARSSDDLATMTQGIAGYLDTIIKGKQSEQDKSIAKLNADSQPDENNRSMTIKQEESYQKVLDLIQKINIEKLSGYDKESAAIDLNAQKQAETLQKEISAMGEKNALKIFGDTDVLFADIQSGADALKQRAADKMRDDAAKKQSDELVKGYRQVESILDKSSVGEQSGKSSEVAKVNAEYSKQYQQLVAISEQQDVSETAFTQIAAARDAAMQKIDDHYAKHFVGENTLIDLQKKRLEIQMQLLSATGDQGGEKDYEKLLAENRAVQTKQQALLKTNSAGAGDSMAFGVKEAIDAWGTLDERIAKVGATFTNSISGSMANGITDMIMGTKTVSQAFAMMGQQVVSELVKIAIQELVVKQIISGISSIGVFGGGGSEQVGSAAGETAQAGVEHGGGVVGGFSAGRRVSPMIFAGAPRFHAGGVIGDEVPIIARRGEVMFTPEQLQLLRGGGGNSKPVQIINTMDPKFISDFLASNPDAVLNIIASKGGTLKKMFS